jgi:hypothetical protein
MSPFLRKLIALFLAIWLPLFGGNAMAASLSMQVEHGSCHESGMEVLQDTGDHQDAVSHAADSDQRSCAACGLCHLACNGYMGAQEIVPPEALQTIVAVTPYLFSFYSITSIPLVPPPLAFV